MLRFAYKGRSVVLEHDEGPRVLIDGREILVRSDENGRYSTEKFAYRDFATLDELARALVDRE